VRSAHSHPGGGSRPMVRPGSPGRPGFAVVTFSGTTTEDRCPHRRDQALCSTTTFHLTA
jgi:hypothetical protein